MRPSDLACPSFACAVALLAGAASPTTSPTTSPTWAETRLTAHYTIAVAGISIGRGDLAVEITPERYVAAGSGRASGFLRILLSGEGNVTARGRLADGQAVPMSFNAVLNDEDERATVAIHFDKGSVADIATTSSAPRENRVPVTEEHRKAVIDPVSAMLVPASAGAPGADACGRTLPIFDGTRRYDLALSFKRVDKVKTATGYQGPVVVCAVAFRPIAGHRADSALVKYLSDGRDLELWLAPLADTHVLGPYRLSVANLVGNLVIQAERFEATTSPTTQVTAPAQ